MDLLSWTFIVSFGWIWIIFANLFHASFLATYVCMAGVVGFSFEPFRQERTTKSHEQRILQTDTGKRLPTFQGRLSRPGKISQYKSQQTIKKYQIGLAFIQYTIHHSPGRCKILLVNTPIYTCLTFGKNSLTLWIKNTMLEVFIILPDWLYCSYE